MTLKGEMMISSNTGRLKRSQTLHSDSLLSSTWHGNSPPPVKSPNGASEIHCNGSGDATEINGTKEENHSNRPMPGPSCKALKHAVMALSRLDDFICEKLGEGFFAEVFKVTHRNTGKVQVLKMNKVQDNKPNVLRELQLMNRLSHPNILRFLGVCVHEGQLHALTEYINSGDLEQLLANESVELPWTVRVKIAHDITLGMTYLHSRGIMHRDLTSKNVLIQDGQVDGHITVECDRYTAVVGDFGLSAKIPDPLSNKQLSTVGSPFWMAPEVIKGQTYTELADVFSFGVICCEITGRVSSDPDVLPRTNSFGIDYKAFGELLDYCPLDFLRLAFRCCQIDYTKRPSFEEAETCVLQLYENLKNDNIRHYGRERRNSTDGSGSYKRSRSEDNILQVNDDDFDRDEVDETFEPTITPVLIGEAMSRDDPFYTPSQSNPFATMEGYCGGRKILGKSFGDAYSVTFDLPSPSSPTTPPCTPSYNTTGSSRRRSSQYIRKSQSLPSSPVLLRKAAERLHLESIHGSNSKKSINPNRYSFSAYGTKSKSVFFPEAVAQRLQFEMYDTGSPYENRSREGSVESDNHFNFMNTFPINKPRRHSQYRDSSQSHLRNNMNSVSTPVSMGPSRQDSVDETGDNLDTSYSVYPSLSYASSAKKDKQLMVNNNNNLPSPTGSKTGSCDDDPSDNSSLSESDTYDPWSMKREVLSKTTILEETVCQTNVRETSV